MSHIGTIASSRRKVSAGSSLNVSGLVSLWDTTSIDATATIEGDDVDLWTDTEGTNNATNTLTNSPELHIGTAGGSRQVTFDGTDWLVVGTPTNLDFTPQTDEFSIVIRIGDITPTAYGTIIGKGTSTNSTMQWGIGIQDGNNFATMIGGVYTMSSNRVHTANDLYILTVSTTTQILRSNGVENLNAPLTGTTTNSNDIVIGGRQSGTVLITGDIDFIAIYNKVLSSGEISDIETEFII